MSEIRLAGELRKIRTGTQAGFQLCRLPVLSQVRSGLSYTGPVAEPARENTEDTIPTDLSSPGVHVLDRSANSHRKTSSSRSTAYETHTVASQKQLESTRITGKGHPDFQFPPLSPTMVAGGEQCAPRSTITPNKTCSANIYRRTLYLHEHTARGT